MAFPADYSKYQEVTIDSSQVSADLTDFPIYIDLSDLAKAGADIFDTCRSDGGDIRVTKSDGTTELPREIVTIDTGAGTGEMHVKFDGTLSSSSDTTIRIWYNGTDTEPSASATYGSENVWSDYTIVLHMQEDPNSDASNAILDSTSNAHHGTTSGTMTSADQIAGALSGNGLDFDGSNDNIVVADSAAIGSVVDSYTNPWTCQHWAKTSNIASSIFTAFAKSPGNGGINGGLSAGRISLHIRNGPSTEDRIRGDVNAAGVDIWQMNHFVNTTSTSAADFKMYQNASLSSITVVEDNLTTQSISNGNSVEIIGSPRFGYSLQSADEFRLRNGELSSSWITTEYNNQSDSGTFYSTGDEVDGGGSPTPTFVPIVTMF